jgi:hypothetical protein
MMFVTLSWNVSVNFVTRAQHVAHCRKIYAQAALRNDQKEHCIAVCSELKKEAENNPNISTIITGDESWVYRYDPDTKQQSSLWKMPNSLRPKKA